MASNIAHRRATKAARRKKVLAGRRMAQPVSLAEKVKRLAGAPLRCCLLHRDEDDTRIVSVFVVRALETGDIGVSAFLIDMMALGIKDVFFSRMERSDFDSLIAEAEAAAPLIPVDPPYARKLVRSAAAYGASIGLRPPRDFTAIEQFFGDIPADDCAEEFAFGREGRPLYVVGPSETARQAAGRVKRLVEQLGPDGFDFVIPGPLGDEAGTA